MASLTNTAPFLCGVLNLGKSTGAPAVWRSTRSAAAGGSGLGGHPLPRHLPTNVSNFLLPQQQRINTVYALNTPRRKQ
ncbi:hypothetical protein VTJ04DRAFT_5535 [Mycothermus thermophilus]|uniref:uncharacterized protein n=1 Tax=Humicola insolens TaxID=85995 RepID=UPI0037436E9C